MFLLYNITIYITIISIAHCLQFEHSGDFTMQSFLTLCNHTSCAQVQELP